MRVVFRTDASVDIGTGHVMRCLTLADALRERGAECGFICKEHPGHLIGLLRERGYRVVGLPMDERTEDHAPVSDGPPVEHASWLGGHWSVDAARTIAEIGAEPVDLLVVDHYGIDVRWERALRPFVDRIFVIDDIADRLHDADLLLDQNLGPKAEAYKDLIPSGATMLFGPMYALLAPTFRAMRETSITNRRHRSVDHLLITMGGVDKDNVTGWVLQRLKSLDVNAGFRVSVIMGRTAPWIREVQELAGNLPWPTVVRVDVKDMARSMSEADLAIGAAGSTSWERCCLGLPAVLMVLAENQRPIAEALGETGAVRVVDHRHPDADTTFRLTLEDLMRGGRLLQGMASASAHITDGEGADRVRKALMGIS